MSDRITIFVDENLHACVVTCIERNVMAGRVVDCWRSDVRLEKQGWSLDLHAHCFQAADRIDVADGPEEAIVRHEPHCT